MTEATGVPQAAEQSSLQHLEPISFGIRKIVGEKKGQPVAPKEYLGEIDKFERLLMDAYTDRGPYLKGRGICLGACLGGFLTAMVAFLEGCLSGYGFLNGVIVIMGLFAGVVLSVLFLADWFEGEESLLAGLSRRFLQKPLLSVDFRQFFDQQRALAREADNFNLELAAMVAAEDCLREAYAAVDGGYAGLVATYVERRDSLQNGSYHMQRLRDFCRKFSKYRGIVAALPKSDCYEGTKDVAPYVAANLLRAQLEDECTELGILCGGSLFTRPSHLPQLT